MREIKFRAWNKQTRRMEEVKQINLFDDEMLNGRLVWYSLRHAELLQYTGLQDKNGKEIYEGDIIFSVNENGVFLQEIGFGEDEKEYTEFLNGFKIVNGRRLDIDFWDSKLQGNDVYLVEKYNIPVSECKGEKYIEDGWWVVGNIYEHPKLLENEK